MSTKTMATRTFAMMGILAAIAVACEKNQQTATHSSKVASSDARSPDPAQPTPGVAASRKLFLDVHELGSGKVTAKDAAGAHQKDLATEGKHGVDFKAYWVDEKAGKIYCLAEASSAEDINAVHKEAHGLVADKIMEVHGDTANWAPTPGMKLYLDVHHLGAGKVTAEAAAEAHKKDLATQAKYDVKYLNYWLDTSSGTIVCLSEAPSSDAALAVHKEAHGLMPDSIEEVSEGR